MLKIKTGQGIHYTVHEWKLGDVRPMNKVGMSSYPLTSIAEIHC